MNYASRYKALCSNEVFFSSYFCRIDKIRHVLLGDVIVGGGSGYKMNFALFAPTPRQFEMYWIR